MKKIKIILVRGYVFNKNSASYNRNEDIEKMVKNTFDCETINPKPYSIFISNRILRRFFLELYMFQLVFKIKKIVKNKAYNYVIFIRSIDPLLALIVYIVCKTKNVKLAIERNEYPSVLTKHKGLLIRVLYKYLVYSWHYRLFDVIFLMTDNLIKYYGKAVREDCIIQKLPITIDFKRFENINGIIEGPYIFYAGNLSEKKDGVVSLVHSFNNISKTLPQMKLKIAGSFNSKKSKDYLLNLVNQYELEDKVIFLGKVDRNDIPKYISCADILVLPRPLSIQSQGGFPTKLGEYLASGKPVIATKVGEISNYLSENEIFFISPDNIITELEKKVIEIVNNYEFALNVGESGKKTAKKHFSLENNQEKIRYAFTYLYN